MLFVLALPLLLIGYELFMTVSTSNMAWVFLLIGQILVPIACYILATIFNFLNGDLNRYVASAVFLAASITPIIAFSVYYGTLGNALT